MSLRDDNVTNCPLVFESIEIESDGPKSIIDESSEDTFGITNSVKDEFESMLDCAKFDLINESFSAFFSAAIKSV